MNRFFKNEKGFYMIEILIIISIMIFMLVIVTTTFTSSKTAMNEAKEQSEDVKQSVQLTAKEIAEAKQQEEIKKKEQEQLRQDFLSGLKMFGIIVACALLIIGSILLTLYLLHKREQKDKQKDMLGLLRDINKKGIPRYFHLENKKAQLIVHQFEKNGYVFTVEKNEPLLTCNVKKENKNHTLLYFVFNTATQTFDSQNVSKEQIKDEKRDVPIVETFIQNVIKHNWNVDATLNITEESDIQKNKEELQADVPKLETNVLQINLHTLQEQMKTNGEINISKRIDRIAEKLYLIEPHLDALGLEVNHIVQESLLTDLKRLIDLYSILETEEKEKYGTQVEKGIENMEKKIDDIYQKAQKKKGQDIKRMLLLIEKKYKENETIK